MGIDLDLEALNWCLENNLNKVGADGYYRISLFHGNVLHPKKACPVKHTVEDIMKGLVLRVEDCSIQICSSSSTMKESVLPSRDIICAFNYSCCCLHKRTDLVLYFKHAFDALSKRGGIFVMDLYGGRSSECKLRLQKRFSDFTVSPAHYVTSKLCMSTYFMIILQAVPNA